MAVKLQNLEMWVQIYDMPRGFISENILRNIGTSFGMYIKSDLGTFDGGWKPYIRIRVALNVDKPLKRRIKIKREGNTWSWINFKYEKLGTFCFVCGVIGHSERDCAAVYANPNKLDEKAYGTWLRAPSRNARSNTGSRWIRNVVGGKDSWGSHTWQGEASNIQCTTQGDARFMDVDGKNREIDGRGDEIIIKTREMGEQKIGEKGSLNGKSVDDEVIDGYEDSNEAGTVIIDPKRKGIEHGLHGKINGSNTMQIMDAEMSKNLLAAGPGVQAR